ncbi:MAG: amidohydrolase family protein [Burkholderiales bacterium]|nr:amidohydrolase family protein [Burkholderiales bacterium]
MPIDRLRWSLEHCEGISAESLERVAAMGGSIGIQNRLSLDGEQYLARQGAAAAADAPPIGRMRSMGIPLAGGTDGNRATSHNPWIAIHWMLTGETVGGLRLNGDANLLDRTEALRLFAHAGARMSYEDNVKGTLEPGRLADLAVLTADYFSIADEAVKSLESLLTIVGGKIVYAAGPFSYLSPPLLPVSADWLPSHHFDGYRKGGPAVQRAPIHPNQALFMPRWPGFECACAFG